MPILLLLFLLPCTCTRQGDKAPEQKRVSENLRQLGSTADSLKAEVEKAQMRNDSVRHVVDSIRKRIQEVKEETATAGNSSNRQQQ